MEYCSTAVGKLKFGFCINLVEPFLNALVKLHLIDFNVLP